MTSSRVDGDTHITIADGASLTFTDLDWNTMKTVTLAAAEDADTVNGTATIEVASSGLASVTVTATENDNEFSGPVVESVSAALGQWETGDVGLFVALPGMRVSVLNTFTATVTHPQGDGAIASVSFSLSDQTEVDLSPTGGWSAALDMSEIPPPDGGGQGQYLATVTATDIMGRVSAPYQLYVHIVAPPAWLEEDWVWNKPGEVPVVWSDENQKYTFRALWPRIPGLSGFHVDAPINLGLLGILENEFLAALDVTETFSVDGQWAYSIEGKLDVTLLSQSMLYEVYPGEAYPTASTSHLRDLVYYAITSPEFPVGAGAITMYSGPIYTFPGVTVNLSVDVGYEATVQISGRLDDELLPDSVVITPDILAYVPVQIWADALFGVARAGICATPSLDIQLPVICWVDYDPNPVLSADVYWDEAGAHFLLRGYLWADVGWGALYYETETYDIYEQCWPAECLPSASLSLAAASTPPPSPEVDVAPCIRFSDDGEALAVWIHDNDPTSGHVDPDVYYSYWNGAAWSAPDAITANDRYETTPSVAWLSPHPETGQGRAVCVWTQNELSEVEASSVSTFDEGLCHQELYASIWELDELQTWGPPQKLTDNALPDGMPFVASDPTTDRAIAVWVRDGDGIATTRLDWDICYAIFDGASWSLPQVFAASTAYADFQPTAEFNPLTGDALVAWVTDVDGDITTSDDRTVTTSIVPPDGVHETPIGLVEPGGASWPSVAFAPDGSAVLVCTGRGVDGNGALSGDGTRNFLWHAQLADGVWTASPAGDGDIRARWPRVKVNKDSVAVVMFRGFTADGETGFTGDPATVSIDLAADLDPSDRCSDVEFLTVDELLDWQIDFDLDPEGMAKVLTVSSERSEVLAATGRVAAASLTFGDGYDDIYWLDAMPLPPAPTITFPASDQESSVPGIRVTGTAPSSATSVHVYVDDVLAGEVPVVDGEWTLNTLDLGPGWNTITAKGANESGEGVASRAINAAWVIFPDVGTDHWAFDEIMDCVGALVVRGYEDGLYHSEDAVTRDQMAVYVARALAGGDDEVPDPGCTVPPFSDVPCDFWARKQIRYCVDAAVVQGYDDGLYRTDDAVDRGQMAVFIARAMAGGDANVTDSGCAESPFSDVPCDHWARKHIQYCAAAGVVEGFPEGDYRPSLAVTRDQMAVYVARAFGLGL